MMRKAAGAALALVLTIVAIVAANFVVVDRAYSRVTAAAPKERVDAERLLRPLHGTAIGARGEMAPLLARAMQPADTYVRYTCFGSRHGIDVLYDSHGRVRRFWPEYE